MQKTLVGAIRWDAWGTKGVGPQVRDSLSLNRFHFRLPFQAHIIGSDRVFIPPYSQEIIDKEIEYAKAAGIDYWAFCWYAENSDGGGLDSARKLYLSSEHRKDVKWCPILGVGFFSFETHMPELVEQMKEENYQKVCDGRPLVYIFGGGSKEYIDNIRAACAKGGVPNPCIYLMGWGNIWEKAIEFGADGISCYANGARNGAQYSELCTQESNRWEHDKQGGLPIIPTVTTGWDKRPRYYHPVTWEWSSTNSYPNEYTFQGTDSEIAEQLKKALAWCAKNKDNSPANSVIIYAWNENDEGGWIAPTLKELEDYGRPVRLDAIKAVLEKYNK